MSQFESFAEEELRRAGVAAPDLLAACETFVAHYPSGVNPFLDEAYRQARKAIAKARGPQVNEEERR